MAVLKASNPTLLDLAKRQDPDGKIAGIVEILNETNEVLDDMVWVEGNLPTGNRTTIRSGLPAPTWRKLYGGVQPNKSTTVQVTDNVGNLEAYAEIDKDLADLNGNSAMWRLSEEKAFIEGLSQEMAATLFYGNEDTAPEEFTGLGPRFNDNSGPENADNIIDAGGSGTDNNTIWLVVWGENTCHGIIPKGSIAGLQVTDKGVVTLEDASDGSNTGRMEAYRTHYQWKAGLTVRDWRYIVRIANIDKSLLAPAHASGADLPDLMFQAMRLIPNLNSGRPAFYMSRDVATMVARQVAVDGASSFLTSETNAGDIRWTERFHGIPIRRCDALSADEARVT
jgi:hypothetical protein